ncbi:MAG: hypothetical protein KIS81_08925 [Maricaulaceae bacterium]|nr:hypothetical protein [Maricaulaceae bacterium]
MTDTFRALAAPLIIAGAMALAACEPEQAPSLDQPPAPPASPQDVFWANLCGLTGQAFEGRIVANRDDYAPADAGPDPFEGRQLVVHFRDCSDEEIRAPFHVGDDRSRTWVFTRTETGLRLKHDHRHEDGTDDEVTMYGGDTAEPGTPNLQAFPVDQYSIDLFERVGLTRSVTNVWVVGVEPGEAYTYSLQRPGREFTVRFDLTRPLDELPPQPWGDE